MNPKISVIIPVKNEGVQIGNCLQAVLKQTLKPYEVIVVDGHSTDDTVANALKFPVKVLYEEQRTRAGANNVGIASAQGDYIAFTDADCIPEEDWLKNLYKEFGDGIAGVGGGIKNIGEGLWENSINLATNTFLGSANSVQGRYFKHRRFVNSISGCNSMYRKEDIITCGGFNASLSTAEDTDLNHRILNLGKLVYTPDAIILHNHKRGLKDFRKRMYQYGYGRAKSGLWDLQVVPPVFGLLLGVSIIFYHWPFIVALLLYGSLIVGTGVVFGIRHKKPQYLISIPAVYVQEHISYSSGILCGSFEMIRSMLNPWQGEEIN